MARRRILRFFGSRGDLLAAEAPGIVVYDASGEIRDANTLASFARLIALGLLD